MKAPPAHACKVVGSPWTGVYCTDIESACHFGKHWHATYGLGYLQSGAQSSASGCGQVDAFAGDLITTNPGEVHNGRPLGGASRRWRMVYLEPETLASMSGDQHMVALTRPVIQDPRLGIALKTLLCRIENFDITQGSNSAAALACEESLVETCTLLLNAHSTARTECETAHDVSRVRDRLADESLEAPTLGDLAAMVDLSRFQVLRRFEKTYGVPPHAWLLLHRAELARGLIRNGASLVQAAADCGFADQSHMTRIFARHFGFTPGAWRKTFFESPRNNIQDTR
ncbi:AraC family transcriptional regulator [Caballeronia sp. dw_276]|uniref:AraC family transcriptional regulator n=1 Tax=Caballeronia sp. dw_276 TaxID=2719795 RepID=UPI001BD37C02|nr:AraC family transcriptional regulator [Caballeronia sp. dw_276]